MTHRLLTREGFRDAVAARDRVCVGCGGAGTEAHHLLDRALWPDGGYYMANGVWVCNPCHWKCETTEWSVEFLRARAGIMSVCVPEGFDTTAVYDKWGNQVRADGTRAPGPLWEKDGVRKVMQRAGLAYLVQPP